MCGICGIFERNKDNKNLMHDMLDIIEHRGPDDATIYSHKNVTLGHRRLSIIDVDNGQQPIFNEDKTICVIFNGELYNYKKFRELLGSKGHKFSTHSDTEILVHCYEEFGLDFIKDLNGIFAFAIYDLKKEKLILARDHFGVKPLHYYFKNGILIFGSEQKSIILHPKVERKMNLQSLHLQINLRYTQGEETLFEGIKRLAPAHFLVFDKTNIKLTKYWEISDKKTDLQNRNEIKEKIDFLLKQAVKRQLMSDVPVGVYLSGGMDSSTIVQKMAEIGVEKINTFTLGFNEPTDEFPDAKIIAEQFGTNHHTMNLSMNPIEQFATVMRYAEEPKINLLQGFNMSKFVQPHVKVILGGMGGDEIFAGYDIHNILYPCSKISKYLPKSLNKLLKFKSDLFFKIQNRTGSLKYDEYRRGMQMVLSINNFLKSYLITRNVWDFDNGMYDNIYAKNVSNFFMNKINKVEDSFSDIFNNFDGNNIEKVLFTEQKSKMVNDYLLVEDRMSMSHSIEERVPFLDKDLVEFMNSLPIEMKMSFNKPKQLFREVMKGKLPEHIISKKKWGFAVNPYLQFKKDLKFYAERILTKDYVQKQNIFNYNYLQKILNAKPTPQMRWHYNYIWVVMGIAIFDKMFIKSDLFKKTEISMEEFL